jgi:hypothetical protein
MMNRHHLRALAAAAAVVLASHVAYSQAADPKPQVTTVIQDAIRLIEGKKYAELFKTLVWPAEVEGLVAKYGSIENLGAEFGKTERPDVLLKALQAALKVEPTFERDGTIARFTFDRPVGRERGLVLQKQGDRWYLRD